MNNNELNYERIVEEKRQKLQEHSIYVKKIYEKNNRNLKELFLNKVNQQVAALNKQNEFRGGNFRYFLYNII